MAQTKRKRRSKHRGNAAGTVEARGRTGRKPRPEEKKAAAGRGGARAARATKPPTWRSSAVRAALTAALLLPVLLLILKAKPAAAAIMTLLAFLIYVPMSYYTDLWVYRRKQKREAAK